MRYVTVGYIFHNKKLLMVFHKKLQTWLPVGGYLEGDETFEESLLREIKEETNLQVKILNPLPLSIHSGIENGVPKTWLQYLCRVDRIDTFSLQKDELDDYRWIEKKQIDTLDTYPMVKTVAKTAFDMMGTIANT